MNNEKWGCLAIQGIPTIILKVLSEKPFKVLFWCCYETAMKRIGRVYFIFTACPFCFAGIHFGIDSTRLTTSLSKMGLTEFST